MMCASWAAVVGGQWRQQHPMNLQSIRRHRSGHQVSNRSWTSGSQGVRNNREELLLKYEGIAEELTQQEEDLKREMSEWRRRLLADKKDDERRWM
eukprot:2424687-Amphidinium_carterae.1